MSVRLRRAEAPSPITFGRSQARPVAPTVHVVGLSLLMLAPGLLVCGLIEWGSTESHDEAALFASARVVGSVGWAMRRFTWVGTDVHHVSVFSAVAWTFRNAFRVSLTASS